jgi:hypothetical protein
MNVDTMFIECRPCQGQTYKADKGNFACTPCPDNSAAVSSAMNATLKCSCLPGFYATGRANARRCARCVEGMCCFYDGCVMMMTVTMVMRRRRMRRRRRRMTTLMVRGSDGRSGDEGDNGSLSSIPNQDDNHYDAYPLVMPRLCMQHQVIGLHH